MADTVTLKIVRRVVQVVNKVQQGKPGTPVNHDDLLNIGGSGTNHLSVDEQAGVTASPTPITAGNPAASQADVVGSDWEKVLTQKVIGAAVKEILFTGLDFTSYEYALDGFLIAPLGSGLTGDTFRWYATEANSGAVVVADYRTNRAKIVSSVQDSQSSVNFIMLGTANTVNFKFEKYLIYRDDTGFTKFIGSGQAVETYGTVASAAALQIALQSFNAVNVNSPTHFGIYNNVGNNLEVGSWLTLWRRPAA